MNLLIVAALVAVCGAAKLDRTYLPPASARTAGGSPGAIQTPNHFVQDSAPKGSYTNDFQGVVVDAALAGTRGASGSEETGLGGPRNTYGSTASKVGEAAFRGGQAGFRFPQGFGSADSHIGVSQEAEADLGVAREIPDEGFGVSAQGEDRTERPQASQERAANTLRFDSEVGVESFNYAFETDNGISAEETGTATDGVKAQGGYSYTGDDGKVYSVTYTADEEGYRPVGDHLPTPPPIPEEILKSLEQNARDEANGVIDDGLYDPQKYNAGSDYADSDSANGKQNGRPSANTGNGDVDASGTFINQNIQSGPFNPNDGGDKTVNQFSSGQSNAGNRFGSRNEYLPPFQQRPQNKGQTPHKHNSDANSSSASQQESIVGSGDFHSQSQQTHTSQSVNARPTSNNQVNGFKQSTIGQSNQNGNRFSSQRNQQQFGSAPHSASQNRHNQFSAQASASFNSQKATSIPDTELTTPFEDSSQDAHSAQPSAPTNTFGSNNQPSRNGQSHSSQSSHHQISQASVQPTSASTNAFGFNSRPSHNGQSQTSSHSSHHQSSHAPVQPTAASTSTFGFNARPSHKEQSQSSSHSSYHQSSQSPVQPTSASTNTFGFNSKPSHNEQSQLLSQSSHHQTSHASAEPTTPPFPQSLPQSSNNRPFANNINTQSTFSTQAPRQQEQFTQQSAFGNKRPQISQNQFSQNTDNQFSPSTQRPQFAQQATSQDDSYYYNQPSRAFNTPQSGSRFSSASSNQFARVTQRPFASQSTTEEENYPSGFLAQNGQRQGSTRRPSFSTESTLSDNQFQSNGIASATNGITQASISSFPAPTSAPSFNRQHSTQRQQFQQTSFQSNRPSSPEPSKPSFSAQSTSQAQSSGPQSSQFEKQNFESAKPLSQQPLQDVKQVKLDDDTKPDEPVTKYTGEVYDYTKPEEMLPAPQDGFGQFGTKMPSTQKANQSRPQFGQSSTTSGQATSHTFAPQPTQFTQSAKTQQGSQFVSRPQFEQSTTSAQATSKPFSQSSQFTQSSISHGNQFRSRHQQPTASSQQVTSESLAPQTTKFSQSSKTQGNQFGSRPQFGQSTTLSQQITSHSSVPQPTQFSQSVNTQQRTQFESRPQFGQAVSQSQQSTFFGTKPQFGQSQGDQFSAQTQEQSTDFNAKPVGQQTQSHVEQSRNQFNNQRRPQSQGSFGAETPKLFGQNGGACCQGSFGQQTFGGRPSQGVDSSLASTFQSNSAFKPEQSQSVAGKGEVFGGPRAPPSFDETGYHY